MKTDDLATLLLDQVVDFNDLVRKLLQIVYSAVMFWDNPNNSSASAGTKDHQANEELAELLQHALDLLLPCVVWQPAMLLKEISAFEGLESLLTRTLLSNTTESTR